MKKVVCLFLSFVLLLSVCPITMAFDNATVENSKRISTITNNAEAFLIAVGCGNTLEKAIPMYNFNENIEVLYFPLLPAGYLIASYKDGHVIEFSAEGEIIKLEKNSNRLYYNGIMKYYEKQNNTEFRNTLTNDIIEKDELEITFDKPFLAYIPQINYQVPISTYGLEPDNPTPINFVKYESNAHCTITGITNLLQYYHDFKNANVYAKTVYDVYSLRDYLKNNNYIESTAGVYLSWAARDYSKQGVIYRGLRRYLSGNDLDKFTVNVPKASATDVKVQLNTYSRPVLMDVPNGLLMPGSKTQHVIMAYTYWETANTTYFITNDGYGNNSVHICADDLNSSFEIMYLS